MNLEESQRMHAALETVGAPEMDLIPRILWLIQAYEDVSRSLDLAATENLAVIQALDEVYRPDPDDFEDGGFPSAPDRIRSLAANWRDNGRAACAMRAAMLELLSDGPPSDVQAVPYGSAEPGPGDAEIIARARTAWLERERAVPEAIAAVEERVAALQAADAAGQNRISVLRKLALRHLEALDRAVGAAHIISRDGEAMTDAEVYGAITDRIDSIERRWEGAVRDLYEVAVAAVDDRPGDGGLRAAFDARISVDLRQRAASAIRARRTAQERAEQALRTVWILARGGRPTSDERASDLGREIAVAALDAIARVAVEWGAR